MPHPLEKKKHFFQVIMFRGVPPEALYIPRATITKTTRMRLGGPLSHPNVGVSNRDSSRRASNDGTNNATIYTACVQRATPPDRNANPDSIFPPAPLLGSMAEWHSRKAFFWRPIIARHGFAAENKPSRREKRRRRSARRQPK